MPADLVVQSPSPGAHTISAFARRVRAAALVPVGAGTPAAYRLVDVEPSVETLAAAREARLDAAWVPRERRLDDVGVVAMDMDSTLITIECIDEIADFKGLKAEVSAITQSAMRGEIDFAQSLTRRVALLAGLPVDDLASVYEERLRLTPGAERMLAAFKAAGAVTALVSGGFTFFTDRLKARLGLDYTQANRLEIAGDRLTGRIESDIVDAQAKARAIRELRAQHPGLAVVMGDGANDLPMFAEADVSVAYRAKPVVREQATHTVDFCGLDAVVNLFR
ncbi:MAG: phosphoserine phosphatase SerB [Burkholderiales bacterium]